VAKLTDMGNKLMKLGKPDTKAAHELREFSSAVQTIHSDFVMISAKYKILSFFELKGYPAIGLVENPVFRSSSKALIIRLRLWTSGRHLWMLTTKHRKLD
jgi:hypothetical protein